MANQYINAITATWNSGVTTFDGIKLTVTDSASAADSRLLAMLVGSADKLVLDKAGNLTITSSDAGASAGPVLTMKRDSATPAASDIIGKVLFQGEDSAGNTQDYADIYSTITDPTSTSEDGNMLFRAMLAGTMTTALTLTGSGASFAVPIQLPVGSSGAPGLVIGSRTGIGSPDPTNGEIHLHIAPNNDQRGRVLLDGYGKHTYLTFRRSGGSKTSPAAISSGDDIGGVNCFGFGSTQYVDTHRGTMSFYAAENWTDSANGTYLTFMTTPIGSATPAEVLRLADNGQVRMGKFEGNISVASTGAMLQVAVTDGSTNQICGITARYSTTAANAPSWFFTRSRASDVGSFASVNNNDRVGALSFAADDGGAFRNTAAIRAEVDGTPGTNDMPGRLTFLTSAPGGSTLTERMRLDSAGNLQMGGTNTVVDSSRHIQLRSYTVAGLPSAAVAGQLIFVSNETGGSTPAFSDGTNWRRVTDRAIVS